MERTLVVDPEPSGHRAFYLSLIAGALGPGRIQLMVPTGHQHLRDCFARRGLDLGDFIVSAANDREGGQLVSRAADIAREAHCGRVFFPFLDSCLTELLTAKTEFPCPVSGIWFHPYALDSIYRWLPPIDKRLRHRSAIHHGLRSVRKGLEIERLFFLDPNSATQLAGINKSIPATTLPDPWERPPDLDRAAARARFNIPQDKIVFLHIGSSEKRKGLADTLTAFQQLAADPVLSQRILLLRVGENRRAGAAVRALLESLKEQGLVKTVAEFVPESEFIEYFAAADWILLPYRRFRFSSGILSNAIAASRPVISSDYGMNGASVREACCGLLFRHGSPSGLARRILEASEATPPPAGAAARDRLDPERFISILRDTLLCS